MKQKCIIKASTRSPKLSLILLDWSCRDWFGALDFLNEQDAPRDSYELIWVECYDRVADYVRGHVDALITLGQDGLYHKHKANNAGLLAAKGEVVTFLDSDALYPRNYISTILNFFFAPMAMPRAILYLNQMRTKAMRPEKPTWDDVLRVGDWDSTGWNYGQGMSVSVREALLAGGFDEHEGFRGFHSGPSELGFRLLNFGLEEVWLRKPVSWHFNHENSTGNPTPDDEVAPATIELMSHWPKVPTAFGPRPFDSQNLALGLAEGRHLPLRENPEARRRRLLARAIPKGLVLMEGFTDRADIGEWASTENGWGLELTEPGVNFRARVSNLGRAHSREIEAKRQAFQADNSPQRLGELVEAIVDDDEDKARIYSLLAQRAFYEQGGLKAGEGVGNGSMVRDLPNGDG